MRIPCDRLAPIIARVLPEYGGDLHESNPLSDANGQIGPLDAMASEIASSTGQTKGAVSKRLYIIRGGKPAPHETGASVRFATADNILSGLGLTHLWHTELADLYEAA